jgi:uncharacterized glyoxalase superfamily protein PhnB
MAAKKAKKAKRSKKKTATRKARPAASKARRPKRHQPETLRLRSVAPSFTVADVEKSLAWYRDVLGFHPTDRWEQDGKLAGVEMVAGRVTFMLGQDDWKKGRDRVKGEGFRLYSETTQDADRLAEQIKARGGTLAQEPKDESWGARVFSVEDPDGYKISIFQKRRRP